MPDRSIVEATKRVAVEFQEAAASAYTEASMWIDGRDRYLPRVINAQRNAATYAAEARMRLCRLIGTE